jgi:signal peptidase I
MSEGYKRRIKGVHSLSLKYIFHLFFYTLWFIALPLAVAWAVIGILDRADAIDEFEFWYVLLLFAILAFVTYSIREKLPFWKDRDPSSSPNKKRNRKEAIQLLRHVQKTLTSRRARKITERGKREVTKAIDDLKTAIEKDQDDSILSAANKLEEKSNRFLAFARKSAGREYFESIGIAVLVAIVLRLFVFEAFKIPSESMVPTLMVGDHIFVSKYRYGLSIPLSNKRIVRFQKPDHGEVVVFLKPSIQEQLGIPSSPLPVINDEYEMVGKDFIKRIVGLPGDKVEMRKDVLYINDKEIPRCLIGSQTYRTLNRSTGGWEDHQAELWIENHGEYLYTVIEEADGPKNDFGPTTVQNDQVFVLGDNRDNSNDSRYWGSVPFDNIKGRAMFIWWSNRRPHGFQWNRVGTPIMSNSPRLSDKQSAALARCPNLR